LTRGKEVLFITADRVTYFRTCMAIPVLTILAYYQTVAAFNVYVIAGVLDFVDGLVATITLVSWGNFGPANNSPNTLASFRVGLLFIYHAETN